MNTSVASKRRQLIRATGEQVKVLLSAFSKHPAASAKIVDALSEETGLPPKWITSWFMRQRAKVRKESRISSSDPMSLEEVKTFKAEYQDPVLNDSVPKNVKAGDPEDNIPPKKKARVGRPKKKIKTEQKDRNNTFSAELPSSPSSLQPPPTGGIEPQDINKQPFSSNYVLRQVIPKMWAPPVSNPRPMPVHSSSTNHVSPTDPFSNIKTISSTSDRPSHDFNQVSHVRTALHPSDINITPRSYVPQLVPLDHAPKIPSLDQLSRPTLSHQMSANTRHSVPAPAPGRVIPQYSPQLPRAYQSSNLGSNLVPIPVPSLQTISHSPNNQENMPFIYPPNYYARRHYPAVVRNRLPNADTMIHPNPHYMSTTQVQAQAPVPIAQPVQFQLPPKPWNDPLFDPSMTPLKHLAVLEPFEMSHGINGSYATLNPDVIADRLLDENLAITNPFQAAMGLVFLSRLGLNWDYT